MNILLLCLPRTRSSLLQDILSQHYQLENVWEPYKPAEFICKNVLFDKPELMNDKFIKAIKNISKKLEQKNNFIAKIFPMQTYNSMLYLYSQKYQFGKNDILDLEDTYNISRYDIIYILKRKNLVDCIVSFYFAHYHSQFVFTTQNKSMIEVYKPKNKIKLNIPLEAIRSGVIDYFVLEYHKNWLEKNNRKVINLDYDEIPNYIHDNFPKLKSRHIETNYNYKEFIINYDEILGQIESTKKELNLDSLLFQ